MKAIYLIDDLLAAEISISGKLQVLDKLLLAIKGCELRALVLFQLALNSEKVSTRHLLDDLYHWGCCTWEVSMYY
ncbi:hypothetical protein HanIR_Chr13g0616891 [Helianthus annuus]|nr:hypothetical protein HanIR_Chr13g0616891 [Helianthus annuus]